MKCPICGCKMKYKICPYCKITDEQVENASNKEVVKARKEGRKNEIYYSSTVPYDVNRMRLILFTIFLGWAGVHSFYVKRNIKGIYPIVTFFTCAILYVIDVFTASDLGFVYRLFFEIFMYATAIGIVMWVFDIFGVLTKTYKIPVVLAEKADNGKYNKNSKAKVVESIEEEVLKEVEIDRQNNRKVTSSKGNKKKK